MRETEGREEKCAGFLIRIVAPLHVLVFHVEFLSRTGAVPTIFPFREYLKHFGFSRGV